MDYDYLAMLGTITFISAIITYPICLIYKRAGFKWYWGLVTLVPLVGFLAMFGALGLKEWPTTSAEPKSATGVHSLYWLVGFSALFVFGIPGADSEEGQLVMKLIFFMYIVGCVSEIYTNAGYSKWGGIMGLLGVTNLIWPWLIAFREWPSVVVHEDVRKHDAGQEAIANLRTAERFGIQPSEIETHSSKQLVDKPTPTNVVTPPPLPVLKRPEPIVPEPSKPIKPPVNIKFTESDDAAENLFDVYEEIAAELNGDRPRVEGIYLRAQVESDGDEEKTRLLYSKYRLGRFLATN